MFLPSGSRMMDDVAAPSCRVCSATRNRCSSLHTITGKLIFPMPLRREIVSWSMERFPVSERNCFG